MGQNKWGQCGIGERLPLILNLNIEEHAADYRLLRCSQLSQLSYYLSQFYLLAMYKI